MARVLLLKASNVNPRHASVVPPLGLLYLAAVLRARTRHAVEVLDLRLHADGSAALDRVLAERPPDVVGISAITVERSHAVALARHVKARLPGTPVMIGGAHATTAPEACVAEQSFDAVVAGEGEEVVVPLVEALLERAVPALPGVHTAATPPDALRARAPAPDVDALPLPAWDLVDLAPYHARFSMSSTSPWRYALLSTSRGCPFGCSYCHTVHGRRFRPRSVESVQAELDLLGRVLGEGMVEIVDDTFNLHAGRANAILERLCATDGRLRPSFPNGLRSDLLEEDTIDLMARSRTAFVSFAVETASPRLQRRIAKNLDLHALHRAAERVHAHGIYSNGFFMLGFPTETAGEMWETVRFSLSLPIDQAEFFRVIPFPGTPLWDELGADAVRYAGDLETDYFSSDINLSAAPDWQVRALYRAAYLAFYGRPRTIASLARRFPDKRALVRRGWQTLRLLGPRAA